MKRVTVFARFCSEKCNSSPRSKSNQPIMVSLILFHAIVKITKVLWCMSQLGLSVAYIIYVSGAFAVFRERLIEYLKDKGIEVTYLMEQCDVPRHYKLAQAFLHLAEDTSRCQISKKKSVLFTLFLKQIMYITHGFMSATQNSLFIYLFCKNLFVIHSTRHTICKYSK